MHLQHQGEEQPHRQTVQEFCTQHYGTEERLAETQAFVQKRLSERERWSGPEPLSYTVIGDRKTISRKAGLSVDEIKLASEAAHYIQGLDLPLWYVVVSDQYSTEESIRDLIRDVKSDIARAQNRSGLPACCWLEILEGRPAVHSNILFPLGGPKAQRLIEGLLRSKKFPGDTLRICRAEGVDWFVAYCSKERFTQARYVGIGILKKRLPGSHPLGAGGGDRVRLSKALKDQLLEEDRIRPYRRSYAARSLRKAAVPVAARIIRDRDLVPSRPLRIFGRRRAKLRRSKHSKLNLGRNCKLLAHWRNSPSRSSQQRRFPVSVSGNSVRPEETVHGPPFPP